MSTLQRIGELTADQADLADFIRQVNEFGAQCRSEGMANAEGSKDADRYWIRSRQLADELVCRYQRKGDTR